MDASSGSERRDRTLTDLPAVLLTEILSRLPQTLNLDALPGTWDSRPDHSRRHAAVACRALNEAARDVERQLSVQLPRGVRADAFLARLAAWTKPRRVRLLDLRLPGDRKQPHSGQLDLAPLSRTSALQTLLLDCGGLKVESLRGFTQLTQLELAPALDYGQEVGSIAAQTGSLMGAVGCLTRLARLALPDLITGLKRRGVRDIWYDHGCQFAALLPRELALLPAQLSGLVQLTRLDLSSLAVTEVLLSSLPQLQHLRVRREQLHMFSALDAGVLQQCRAVTCLEMSGVLLRTSFPVLKSLVAVHLKDCCCTCSLDLARFKHVKHLSVLVTKPDCTYERLVGMDYTSLRRLTQLECLTIEGAAEPTRLVSELRALRSLSVLRLVYRGRAPVQLPVVCGSLLPALCLMSLEGSHRTGAWWEPPRPPGWWQGGSCWEGSRNLENEGWTLGFLSHGRYNGVTTFTRETA